MVWIVIKKKKTRASRIHTKFHVQRRNLNLVKIICDQILSEVNSGCLRAHQFFLTFWGGVKMKIFVNISGLDVKYFQ